MSVTESENIINCEVASNSMSGNASGRRCYLGTVNMSQYASRAHSFRGSKAQRDRLRGHTNAHTETGLLFRPDR